MKVAVLSNVNMNATIRILKKNMDVYMTEGYGNELGTLMNVQSSIYEYQPDFCFMLEDVCEIIGHSLQEEEAEHAIAQWFDTFKMALKPNMVYFVSDAYAWGQELSALVDKGKKLRIEALWQKYLEDLVAERKNVKIFPYRELIEQEGEKNSFSLKMWYMGKIMHTPLLQQAIADKIQHFVEIESRVPKKVLALDLDNTLWGGLAGEHDSNPIVLSDDHAGLAYKNLQRVILAMKEQGVLLCIVSKNNEADVDKIFSEHPHMVLKKEDFVARKINWDNKADNLKEIATELNLGLDSFVFFDDQPTERQIIKDMLPDVTVPDFPDKVENLAQTMLSVWTNYFERTSLTAEDREKTKQYASNVQREESKKNFASFEDYLQGLKMKLVRKQPASHVDRVTQLLNKTNQFNLTTRRHTENEIQEILDSENKKIFVYQQSDRFGDNGIISVVIAEIENDTPVIKEFVMSCRVMGKNVEDAIVEDVEDFYRGQGYSMIEAEYMESNKNQPVKNLYSRLGYEKVLTDAPCIRYRLDISGRPDRNYRLSKEVE